MNIHLGYELGTGKPVAIPLGHLVVTGQTQASGKTTTLEALIVRAAQDGLRAVAFITKRGEGSFLAARKIPPYFRERTDWQFVAAILEATLSERLKFQRAWIMKLCEAHKSKKAEWKAPRTLADVLRNVEIALETASGINESVYTELREYLRLVVPQIEKLAYSTSLQLNPGLNVMDLCAYDFPVQALIMRSAIEWVYKHEKDTVVIIPEAWEFMPQKRNSPVKLAAEEFARKGAALRNFMWIDSQDLAGVDKVMLRGVSVWLFGVQRELRELERTLNHIPADIRKPRPDEIAKLSKGQFIVCFGREQRRVYVQPWWVTDSMRAARYAMDEKNMPAADRQTIATMRAHLRSEETEDLQPEVAVAADMEPAFDPRMSAPSVTRREERGGGPDGNAQAGQSGNSLDSPATSLEAQLQDALQRLESERATNIGISQSLLDARKQFREAEAERLKLKDEVARLKAQSEGRRQDVAGTASPTREVEVPAAPASNGTVDLDAIYNYVVARARGDSDVLEVITLQPELRITIEKKVVRIDGKSLFGRVATLVHEGLYDQKKPPGAAIKELRARGINFTDANVYVELDKLTEMGFLRKERTADRKIFYEAVPAMKANLVEA